MSSHADPHGLAAAAATTLRPGIASRVRGLVGFAVLVAATYWVLRSPAWPNLLALILGGFAFGAVGPLVRALTEVIHVNPPGGASELRRRAWKLLPPARIRETVRLDQIARIAVRVLGGDERLRLTDRAGSVVELRARWWQPPDGPLADLATELAQRDEVAVSETAARYVDVDPDASVADVGPPTWVPGAAAGTVAVLTAGFVFIVYAEPAEPVRQWLFAAEEDEEVMIARHAREMCRPIDERLAVSDAVGPTTADVAAVELLPDAAALDPEGLAAADAGWEGERDLDWVAGSGPDEADRRERLTDLGFVDSALREWWTHLPPDSPAEGIGTQGDIDEIVLRVDVTRFGDYEDALAWHVWVLRNACRYVHTAGGVDAVPDGVLLRWHSAAGREVEQIAFVHGPYRVRMDTHRHELPDDPVLAETAERAHRHVARILEERG